MLRFVWSVFAQVATAIRGAIIQAKMSVVPVRRGYWGNKIGKPHTVPTKVLLPVSVASLQTTIGPELKSLDTAAAHLAQRSPLWAGQSVTLSLGSLLAGDQMSPRSAERLPEGYERI